MEGDESRFDFVDFNKDSLPYWNEYTQSKTMYMNELIKKKIQTVKQKKQLLEKLHRYKAQVQLTRWDAVKAIVRQAYYLLIDYLEKVKVT